MGHHSKICLVLPLLLLVNLADIVVADEGSEDLGQLDLGHVLAGARVVAGAKLQSGGGGGSPSA